MKRLLFLMALVGLGQLSFGQIETSAGFKGGVLFNQFHGKSLSNGSLQAGPQIGGFFNLGLADISQFQFEILYQRQMGLYSTDSLDYDIGTGYIEIPLLYKLRFPVKEGVFPYLSIGQSVGYKISEDAKTYSSTGDGKYNSISNQLNTINVSTLMGIGVDFESENVNLFLDARFANGNINISNNDAEIKSRYLAITLGVGYKLNKEDRD